MSVGLAAPPGPQAVVVVDGRAIPAVVGAILKRGVLVQDPNGESAYCSGLGYEIRVDLPAGIRYGRVDLAAPGCALTVTSVEFSGTADPVRTSLGDRFGFAANAATQHRVWGRHAMYEYVNIITTSAYQDFTYDDDGSSVWNPQVYSQYCWHDGVGWSVPILRRRHVSFGLRAGRALDLRGLPEHLLRRQRESHTGSPSERETR